MRNEKLFRNDNNIYEYAENIRISLITVLTVRSRGS